jgi:hypothetical protein
MKEYTGGPAFPVTEWHLNGSTHSDWRGMTLRDYFAAKAMQALTLRLASKEGLIVFDDAVAESAYLMADAMLKARRQA